MPELKIIEQHQCHGGVQRVVEHASSCTGSTMRFGVYQPPGDGPFPALMFLSGLTCSEQNFITKAHAQAAAAREGLVIIAPDTSPRDVGIPGAEDDDAMGTAASFYVDATETPWSAHYQMFTYVTEELPQLAAQTLPIANMPMGIFGHSMGGHGALVCGLRKPDRFLSLSAFSPVCSPTNSPWGINAFKGYLGDNTTAWRSYDAAELIRAHGYARDILVDIGTADPFLEQHLKPELLESACRASGVSLELRRQPNYDHSYYFISTFIDDHIRFHAERLRA